MQDHIVLLCDYNLLVFVRSSAHLLGFASDGCAQVAREVVLGALFLLFFCLLHPVSCLAQVLLQLPLPGSLH